MVLCIVLAVVLMAMGVCSWMEKGLLLNNAWLFASEQERETMDKGPYYRQSAITFGLSGAIFLLLAAGIALDAVWPVAGAGLVAVATVVYALASTVSIEKAKRDA